MFVGDNDHGDTEPTNDYKSYYWNACDTIQVLEDRLECVMTDRNNLELRLQELEEALSLLQEENNELTELLAEADDNVMWLSKDVSIAEEELRLARKEICHMACSEDLFSYKGQTPVEVAYYMGWDCFKENADA